MLSSSLLLVYLNVFLSFFLIDIRSIALLNHLVCFLVIVVVVDRTNTSDCETCVIQLSFSMDKSVKGMKRENELLDAIKSSSISSVQRILSKCRSGRSSKYPHRSLVSIVHGSFQISFRPRSSI